MCSYVHVYVSLSLSLHLSSYVHSYLYVHVCPREQWVTHFMCRCMCLRSYFQVYTFPCMRVYVHVCPGYRIPVISPCTFFFIVYCAYVYIFHNQNKSYVWILKKMYYLPRKRWFCLLSESFSILFQLSNSLFHSLGLAFVLSQVFIWINVFLYAWHFSLIFFYSCFYFIPLFF